MSKAATVEHHVEVEVENIGGIDSTAVGFDPGVTILSGRNATNRTSLLRAIMAGLGSEQVSLKGDAEEGNVTLKIGDNLYERTLIRRNGAVILDGETYTDDIELADLFAFLLESNEARRAVALDADLRELLMRPIDVEEIKARTIQLQNEKRAIDDEIDKLDALDRELTELEARRADLKDEIESLDPELESARERVQEADEAVGQSDDAELQKELDRLQSLRSDLADARFDIDTEQESLESLHEQREDLLTDQEAIPDTERTDLTEIKSRMDQLRGRQRELDSTISQLQNVIQFNREMLDNPNPDLATIANNSADQDGSVTDQLVDGDSVICWTCGTEVEEQRIDEAIRQLNQLRQDKAETRRQVREELDTLKREQDQIEEKRSERERIESTLERIATEIANRESRLETLQERVSELESAVDELEDTVEAREHDVTSDLIERQREVSRLEFTLEQKQRQLRSITDEITEIEERLDRRSHLERRRSEINDELEEQRTKIERVESEAIEAFNNHMAAVLDILEYENLDRIWIDRVENGRTSGTINSTARFDLHVTRSTDDGTVYRDTIDHLSESEREVTGLIFALAGYLVHEVHDVMPFMILDSLEALDSGRISKLLDYLGEYASYVLVALLPEDASAVDSSYTRITEI